MFYANYHTHSVRCNHASGTEKEYVEAAIANGFGILGFSDHTPYFAMPREHYSGFRMKPELADDYFNSIEAVKEEYKGKIKIYSGVECEFYPAFFEEQLRRMRDYPVEYFIMGQHFVGNEHGSPYTCNPTDDEEFLKTYVKQVCRGIDTDAYTYIAHPDIPNFVGNEIIYEKHMKELCKHALKTDTPLELNLLGLGGRRHYPSDRFFKIVGEVGNKVVLGWDAHNPGMLAVGETYNRALELVEKFKLNLVNTVELRDPKKAHFKE